MGEDGGKQNESLIDDYKSEINRLKQELDEKNEDIEDLKDEI